MTAALQRLFATRFPEVEVPASAWHRIERHCTWPRLGRGATLFSSGQVAEALYGVISGEVEIRFTTIEGSVSVVEHVRSDGLFGLASFVAGLPSRYDAVAVRPARLVAFGPAAYRLLMDEVAGFSRSLMREIARRHDALLGLLEASRHRTAMARLTLALAQLIRARGAAPPRDGGFVFVRGNQAELAALANLSRQTVNELIGRLTGQGRAKPGYGGLWIASDWVGDGT